MLGLILRLIAAGEGNRGAGKSVKNLTRKYLVLGIAGMIFATALAFATLAAFWAIEAWIQDPIWAAAIMGGILILASLLTTLIAYGITEGQETPSPGKVISQALLPVPIEDVGRHIETAAHEYGAVRVATAAAAGGVLIGILAKKFGQI